ncbi:MAG: rRNA cytosine-C5-methyltransferase [marine benthic group bacterium]|nr:rRNA cytosine-C5-methyltransferase [Gemmatimonadota bacterium]
MSRRDRGAGGPGVEVRRAAFRVLSDVREGSYADRAAADRFRELTGRDRALGQEIAYGTIRLRDRLDAELSGLVDRPLTTLDPPLLDWLRLGLYQLRETRIPPHAAVHATVEGTRSELGRGPSGLANAVLRRADREAREPPVFSDPETTPEAWLSTYGSHPDWLIRRWLARWPLADVRRLVENDNRAPPVTLRLLESRSGNLEPGDTDSELSLEPLPDWPGMVRLMAGDPARVLARRKAIAQDPAASAVVEFIGPEIEGPVLDVCAAPGGKAAALAQLAPGARPFVAADVAVARTRLAAETLRRTGSDARPVVMDGRRPAIRSARTVLLDAPCSGTGVLRRRPDARWRISERRLDSLRDLQAELLDACAELLEPGGLLVYATCSLEPEENQAQVESFLSRRPEFEREPSTGMTGRAEKCLTECGDLEVLPFETGTDGAFASRLRKGDNG